MFAVDIPIKDPRMPPTIRFPDRCVSCGNPKEVVIPIKLDLGVQKRKRLITIDVLVTLCKKCEQKERRVANVTIIPFFFAGLVTFIFVFIPVWLIMPTGTTMQTIGFSAAIGALIGIVAGIIGGTLVEFLLKLLFTPVYGQLLLKRPLTIVSMFDDSFDVIGLSIRLTKGKHFLTLVFENDDVGREIARLNPAM
jgi:hypothetical protein